jgi:hypothetical protein
MNLEPIAMNDDELLHATVDAARLDRKRVEHEERLDAYADGKLSADELAAAARADDVDAHLVDELAAFRPLGDDARARIAGRVLQQIAAPKARARGARFRRLTIATSAFALAAAVLLFVRARDGSQTLPPYEVSFVGGEQPLRGPSATDPGEHKFSRGQRFRILLRPRTALQDRVGAKLFLRRADDVRVWDAPVDVSNEGAIRVVTSLDTLPPASDGAWELVVAVGRPDALPSTGAELDEAHAARGDYQLVTTHVRFEL